MKKDDAKSNDELRPAYNLRQLRVRKLGMALHNLA
jgi:hypothetical protein